MEKGVGEDSLVSDEPLALTDLLLLNLRAVLENLNDSTFFSMPLFLFTLYPRQPSGQIPGVFNILAE